MAGKRVAVLDPDGRFGTIDEADVPHLPAGARLLTRQEQKAAEVQQKYDEASTLSKIGGIVAGVGARPPELEAWSYGGQEGALTELSHGVVRQGADVVGKAVGVEGAGEAYAQHVQDVKEAHPEYYGASKAGAFVGGMLAGSSAGGNLAARAAPHALIGAAGTAAEGAIAESVAQFAGRGLLGRAATSAASLGARGAIEGGLYGAAQQFGDDMFLDREAAADKIIAASGHGMVWGGLGGAALGGGGSLVVSGVRAGLGGLSRAMGRARGPGSVVDDAARAVTDETESAARAQATDALRGAGAERPLSLGDVALSKGERLAAPEAAVAADVSAKEASTIARMMDRAADPATQKGWAYEQVWKAIGGGQGLQTTRYAKQAAKYLPNGTKDVGEVLIRKGVLNPSDGVVAAMRGGTPADMLPKIAAAAEANGQRIGSLTEMSGATVRGKDIAEAIAKARKGYGEIAGREGEVAAVNEYGNALLQKLGLVDDKAQASIQSLLKQRKGLDDIIYAEQKTLDPKGRLAAMRDVRSELEELIMRKLDDASGRVPGEFKAEYKALKKDHVALSIARDAAEDSAARMSKGATLGMRDMLYGGGNVVASVGHKLVRERGNAAAAVLIHRMAESGALTRAIQSVDAQIGRSAKGLLSPPSKRPLPEPTPTEPVRARAEKAMKQIAKIQANPEAYIENLTRQTEALGTVAPEVSGHVVRRMTEMLAFLAGKVPVAADKDPLDPHPAPRMSEAQAAEMARYAWYAEKPARFFVEVEHGKLTYEGAEVAKVFMPKAFAELQAKTLEAIAAHMAAGRRIPYEQRIRIGTLLDIAADPSQRVAHADFLQQNVLPFTDTGEPDSVAPAPKRPLQIPTQQSAFDQLEASGPGRR